MAWKTVSAWANKGKHSGQNESSALITCRALSEDEQEAKSEVSANGTCALNENETEAKFEFSAAGIYRTGSLHRSKV